MKHIRNGGIEQAILEAVNQDGLLNDKDKERLKHLQSLPQDRTETNNGKIVDTSEILLPHEEELFSRMKYRNPS